MWVPKGLKTLLVLHALAAMLSTAHAGNRTSAVSSPTVMLGACEFKRVFHQPFGKLVVTPHAVVGESWIAHTPWNGDFGDAIFVDPKPGFPFTIENGDLVIEARKQNDRWASGLIASADAQGKGFARQYGYFEISARLPAGKGLWPAIWLASAKPVGTKAASVEIDLIEHYGHFPSDFHSVVHSWSERSGEHVRPVASHVESVKAGTLYDGFHRYGVDVEREWTTFFLDRRQFWRVRTPPEHKFPLMILIDLALGSGWSIDETPNPSRMRVAYADVFERPDSGCSTQTDP